MPSSACARDHRGPHSFPTRRSSDLMRQRSFDEPEVCVHVRLERAIELLVFELFDRLLPVLMRGVVDENIEPAELGDRLIDRLLTELRSEEHTSELQSRQYLVCRLLLVPATTEVHTLSLHDALPI